ncbi:MAG: ABC transporter ATP-binding protein [Cellulosilyticaceae bacterium]
MNAIEMNQVKKKRGDFELDIQNLKIPKGYITGFVGQNGSGKTTTMKLIMQLLWADKGHIKVLGKEIKDYTDLKEKIGYVGEPIGYPTQASLSVLEKMVAPFYKQWDTQLFHHYITLFGLDSNKKIDDLSTGQSKQAALIMALAYRPELILLDEPTSNLDPVMRSQILDILMEHMQNEAVSVFYSTHITSDLEKAGDYIVYIKDGKIIFNEPKDSLQQQYCVIKGSKRFLTAEAKGILVGVTENSFGFEAMAANKEKAYNILGEEVKYERATLEDIMIYLARGNK